MRVQIESRAEHAPGARRIPAGGLRARRQAAPRTSVVMKVRVFTLRWDDGSGRFDDADLRGFLEDDSREREVLDVSEHFFVHERRPTWAVMVMYRDVAELGARRLDRDFRKDWRAELDEPGRKLYDELRLWRAKAAKREGLPPYLICNNRRDFDGVPGLTRVVE